LNRFGPGFRDFWGYRRLGNFRNFFVFSGFGGFAKRSHFRVPFNAFPHGRAEIGAIDIGDSHIGRGGTGLWVEQFAAGQAVDGAAGPFGAFIEQRILTSGSALRCFVVSIGPDRSVFEVQSTRGDFAFDCGTAAEAHVAPVNSAVRDCSSRLAGASSEYMVSQNSR
jgi:hypothetical protein